MKKINYYIIGVTAFSALVLFLVVAMFIGPEPKLRNSPMVEKYTESLASLVAKTEDQNNQLAEELATVDCQLILHEFDQLYIYTTALWSWVAASHTRVQAEEGLLNKETVDLPEPISENLSRIAELTDQRADMIKRKLADCINQ